MTAIKAPVEIEADDLLTDIGWAWVITTARGDNQLIMVRKSVYGSEVARGVAEYLLDLLKKAEGEGS